jgi:hypothetical protein
VIVPINRRLMATPPEAATAEVRRMLERWGTLDADEAPMASRQPDPCVGSAVKLRLLAKGVRSGYRGLSQPMWVYPRILDICWTLFRKIITA